MLDSIFEWMLGTWIANMVNGIPWMFPTLETLHFMGLCSMFGALLVVDLRVIGFGKFVNMQTAMKFIPVILIAFSVNLITGLFFFFSNPYNYFFNIGFQWKMVLIAIAGLNALWFWFGEHKELVQLADGQDAEMRAKVIAVVSLLLWVVIIFVGRFMAFL